jgi:hypothetical protein
MPIRGFDRFLLWILLIFTGGCARPSRATVPTDVGLEYTTPIGSGPATIEGISYEYVATPDREQEIIAGFGKLKIGQSREEVRQAMGRPDSAEPMYGKAKDSPFHGWSYMYKIKMRSGRPNTGDICVQVFFNPDGKLHWAVPSHIAGLSEVGRPGGQE